MWTACTVVCSGAHQRNHQSSASLAFVRGIHRWPVVSPRKAPVTRKMFLFAYGIMSCLACNQLCGCCGLCTMMMRLHGCFWCYAWRFVKRAPCTLKPFHVALLSSLINWPLEDVVIILKVQSPNICSRLSSWTLLVILLIGECHRTHLTIS